MLFGKGAQVTESGHGAVSIHDLDEDAGGIQAGKPGEVGGGFGMAGSAEDTAGFGDERADVPGLHEVLGDGAGIRQKIDGASAVSGADAGGDALCGIDGDGEVGAEGFPIFRHHAFQVEMTSDVERNGDAEHAAAFTHHEVHHFGGDLFSGADQVALVFTIFVIGDDHHFSGSNVSDDIVDGIEGGFGGRRHEKMGKEPRAALRLEAKWPGDGFSSLESEKLQQESSGLKKLFGDSVA